MEIPEDPKKPSPSPKKGGDTAKAVKRELTPEIEAKSLEVATVVAGAAQGIVQSRAKLNMLSFLLGQCEEAELNRSPDDSVDRKVTEKNTAEKFLLDRSQSPLREASEAKKYFEALNIPVNRIDESDASGKTLGDFLDPNRKEEIQKAVEQLQKEDNIVENIREILLQASPELLEDYNQYEEVVGTLSREQNLQILLGENPSDEDKSEMEALLKENIKEEGAWSLLEAEKARILCRAVSLPEGTEPHKNAQIECENVLGSDTLSLIEKQVKHTQNTISRLYASDQNPSNTPEELFCPEILQRMGEQGPNKQQLNALASVQEFYLLRRSSTPVSPEEQTFQKARIALAGLYCVEHGQWIGHTNTMRQYREIMQSKKKDFTPLLDPDATKAAPTEPSAVPGKLKKSAFQFKMDAIEALIEKYNEGMTEDKHRVNQSKLVDHIRKASGETIPGLYSLDETDLKDGGAPKILAKGILDLLTKQKEKEKPGFQKSKGFLSNYAKSHFTKIQQKVFGKAIEEVKEELLHEKGDDYGFNAGIQQAMERVSKATSMDQIS